MNKAELIAQISEDAGVTKTQANAALDSFVAAVTKTLKKGDKVTLVGFGTFSVSKRAARTGRNPQTGQSIEISARRVLTFKPSQVLRAEVNETLKGKEITGDMIRRRAGKDDEDEE